MFKLFVRFPSILLRSSICLCVCDVIFKFVRVLFDHFEVISQYRYITFNKFEETLQQFTLLSSILISIFLQ